MSGASSSAAVQNIARVRRGSDLTDRQIAFAVKDGKAITVTPVNGDPVTGWVFGIDDYHWGLVTQAGGVVLMHKSAPTVEVTEHLLSEQGERARLHIETVVNPFRDYVMRNFFKTA